MKYLLGIDFGGGSSKATLLAENGDVIATASHEYETYYPNIGWTEQNPDDWYIATKENIKNIIETSGIDASDIAGVALDAATHTSVLMDKDFNVLRPAIYWTDTRAQKEVEFLNNNYKDIILQQVLHNPGTIWTLPQLMWVKENEPDVWSKVDKICFAKDYVRHQLTGDYVTDNIEAEGSMLFDFTTQTWSKELCGIIDFPTEKLPKLVKPTDIVGEITVSASAETGLAEGTPVLCGSTDTVMEVFAAGGIELGMVTVKLATAGRICVITDNAYPDKNLINYSHITDGLWYPGTATKACAASYRWFRDTFGGDYNGLNELAEDVPIGSDGLIYHPYLNGELTPYQNPDLCGSFTGIRSNHTKGHFARSVMEGVCMSMKDCMLVLDDIGIKHDEKAVVIGGGSKGKLWRQILADSLGITLIQKSRSDSSFGSAMLAGITVGIWNSPKEALDICNKTVSETVPNAENTKKYEKLFDRYKKIQAALEPIYNEQ
ncbi:MAG: xylulokinase [Clostridia bacterium]|nr:xylulokinase [Clostridia bacterium]MBR2973573.1 xylulokinase [Clostridia bacterium]